MKILNWECNQKTWDKMKRVFPDGGQLGLYGDPLHNLSSVPIYIVEAKPDGWHPVYEGEAPRWGDCCPFENRSMAGGCLSCGDPCI